MPPLGSPMIQPSPPKVFDNYDKYTPEASLDPGDKPEALLNVTRGAIRVPSPNPSLISIDDSNNIRLGRDVDHLPVQDGWRHASHSPVPPRTVKDKARLFWVVNKGLVFVMIAQLFGTMMNVTTRILEVEGNDGKGYHPLQILFVRMIVTAVCASFYMYHQKIEHFPFGLREIRPLLVARGVSGFFGVFGMYYSLQYLPLSDATVITFLAPSLACWACSYLINEPFTRMEQIAAYISLFGVVLIARPASLFTSISHPDAPALGDTHPVNATVSRLSLDYDSVTPKQRGMAIGIAMLGVFGAAGAYTTVRWIGKRAHPLITVNYFATLCTIISFVAMFVVPDVGFLLPRYFKDWCYLMFLGLCGFALQFLLATGLQYEKSSRATNMVYTQMLFALTFDKLIWGTTPSALSIVGSSLILGSAIYVAMNKEYVKKDDVVRGREDTDEEQGLMSFEEEPRDENTSIAMRPLRI
ncbi:hypothetical protein P153DRAFT_368726 [Dothidotthia symphoricarpi CBS 119687]|uniref:EamA domain-containing protein n=1 Tax=Dothidotthia symphoricarpi CBS 119687 TaxID=1392245 RepID=A0A6A6A6J3_9PLEO|nr:uncharacterized protein P153DRAFT_368726 [Dothidotthia symphoricarpi CBS 119687]KAF2127430.1 hypothetical protein P153DRAFT_368726 [Dothidotthia symphoricarpi CBS 119687]